MKKMNPFLKQVTLLLLVLLAIPTATVWAQEMNKKYALTTLMFLDELKEQEEQAKQGPRRAPANRLPDEMRIAKPTRFIASPDTIGGVAYISCFIHLKDVGQLDDVRSLGVEVEETFDRQHFVTARVPVRQLEALADIDNVIQIKVAQLMQPMTDVAREKTHVDDLLTQSDDAIAAGINKKYDGTGVVLGIIDTGIDFQHIAFKDKNGNSRIKRAYVYGSTGTEYKETEITSTMPTTDDVTMDHGTHTASTAGGSSVIVNGSTVTVTDNHASATYGGIAPGADLYLAGVKGLSDTGLTNALKKMVEYAGDKPLVVSNSWGSRNGPHDGTGQWADLVHEYFGDSHPNRIIIFSSANDAGHSINGEGGGFFVKKSSASSSSPLGTIIRSAYYTNTDGGYRYQGLVSYASSSSPLNCKIYVLDNLTGQVLTDWTLTTNTKSFSGLDTYYSGTMSVNMAQNSYTGKYELSVKANELETKQRLGSVEHFTSRYTLAIEIYPASDSADINMWGGHNSYYANILETPDHTWLAGTDDMCVSDEATIPDAISVGAYVSKTQVKNYEGNDYAYNSGALGDIADFSSYATASQSTTGKAYPWITAPGAQLVAGVNHYHTKDVDNTSYFGDDRKSRLVVNSDTDPYASMQGTSMSTPVAAGIVALWLQAAKEVDKQLTVNDVKTIMKETAIKDEFTTNGVNASHFGKGKIDALAGIQYILSGTGDSETIDFTEQGYADAAAVTSVNGISCTVTFDKGTNDNNAPKYYTNGTAVRVYGGNTMTIASATKTITKIELTFGTGDGNNDIITDVVTYSNGAWTGSASSVTFTVGGTSGNRRIQKVKVIYAGSAPGYYKTADGKRGSELKTAMSGIIYNRTEQTYNSLWTAFQSTDVHSDGKIWDMYSNITNYTPVTSGSTYSKEGDCYNREHSWPQSWFGSNIQPMYTDLHHIYPTDGFVNSKRANYPFGETNGDSYKSANDFSKLGTCTYPGYTGIVFEPADEYKGDFARTCFYMVTCYEEKLNDWYTNYSSTDVVNVIDGNKYPGLQEWQLNMLMEWAKNDPVSEKETNRNNAVYGIQENRNPFIDYPGLEEYVWGSLKNKSFSYDEYLKPVYLSFSQTEVTATVGMDYMLPTLTTTPANLAVTYSSSVPSVARVDATTGEITPMGEGTTIITATYAGNDSYNEGSTSYTLTVSVSYSGETSLIIVNNGNNGNIYTASSEKTYDVTLLGRTLYKDGNWNTLCLPFDVTISGSDLDCATARPLESASITGSTLTLTFGEAVTTLTAGTPYIIKWDAANTNIVNPVFTGVTISTDDNSYDNGVDGDTRVRFFGNYDKRTFNSEDKSILFLGSDDKLYYPDGVATTTIGACRAYFKIGEDDVDNARLLTVFDVDFNDGSTTGIVEVKTTPDPSSLSKEAGWYTLDGRRLEGRPTTKGFYINNGRKIIVK